MKKYFFMILAVFSTLILASNAFALEPSLTISWQVLSSKISPGGATTVLLTLSNPSTTLGTGTVRIYISPGPYVKSSLSYQQIGSLGPASSQQTSFTVTANQDAISTDSYITVKATYYTETIEKETDANIPIMIRRLPILQISEVNYSKSVIEAGDTISLSFNIVNNGDGTAEDVRVVLDQSIDIFTASGSGESFINSISGGQAANANFALTVNPSISTGTYSIPVTLAYYDELKNQSYSVSKSIGLTVSGRYNFILTLESQDILTPGSTGSINIKIANAGTQTAKFLTIKAVGSEFRDVNPLEDYMGDLNSDDYDTEKFTFRVDSSTSPGTYPFGVQLLYRDPYGNQYDQSFNVNLKIYGRGEVPASGTPPIYFVIIGIAGIIIIYLIFKRLRKKSK
ncbi:MAG TPA: hypothetical protein VJ343_02720 [archaeon]|nr:hypothetical protein [archaeon]